MTGSNGRDSDGQGTSGIVGEKSREARAGETDTTRFGMLQEGADTDGQGTGGMVEKETAASSAGGVASGLQAGGTLPGGGPGTSTGSLGTGGGSTAGEPSGTLERRDEGELEAGAGKESSK